MTGALVRLRRAALALAVRLVRSVVEQYDADAAAEAERRAAASSAAYQRAKARREASTARRVSRPLTASDRSSPAIVVSYPDTAARERQRQASLQVELAKGRAAVRAALRAAGVSQ